MEVIRYLYAKNTTFNRLSKKEELNLEANYLPEEEQHIEQIAKKTLKQRPELKRFKRSVDNPDLPDNFEISSAIGGGDCFFDSIAQGLKQLKPEMDFTVKSLREVCKRFAQSQLPIGESWLREALRNENEPINHYIPRIEFAAVDITQKPGPVLLGLNEPLWGRTEIEGRIICKEYNVKLHIIEKHNVQGKEIWTNQIVDESGSRSVDDVDYNEVNTIHVVNKGRLHFEPILSKARTRSLAQQESRQSLFGELQSNSDNQLIDSSEYHQINPRSSDSTDYDDEVTPEEELISTIKGNDSEEGKLERVGRLFERKTKLNLDFQDYNGDTALHIAVRKGESKVVKLLVVKGAKINDYNLKNRKNRTPLDIANHLKRQDIIKILETPLDSKSQQHKKPLNEQFEYKAGQQPYRNKNTNVDSQNTRRKQGDPVHGNIYQLKLLMLFLYRGVSHKYSFRLGTEIEEAKKFDDLVFEYTKGGRKEYRLLQAKHRLDESKKITTDNLLTESDGDYSLTKYFFSYQDSKKENLFKGGSIKDVTICTNIDLDFEHLESAQIRVEKIKGKDDILDVKSGKKQPMRYRFNEDVTSLLKPKLQDYNLTKLARRLAECFLKNSSIKDHDNSDIFKSYHLALAEEVINIKTKKFHDKFIEDRDISEDTRKFRKAFIEEIKRKSKEELTLENINQAITSKRKIIDNKQVGLNLSKNFGKGEGKNWPNNAISNDEVKEFLDHLVFAVNQPNEEELGEIVKDEIVKGFDLDFIITENIYNKFFITMLNWLQGKERDRFFSYEEGKEFFEEAIRGIPILFDLKKPVDLFTGRKQELSDLHSLVQRSSEKATVISQMTSVSGLGGIGKTELARQYIHEHSKDYDNNIIWINAESEVTLIESFRRLAQDKLRISTKNVDGSEKDIKSIVEEVYRFFSKRKSFFVLDNAEKNEILNKFLPIRSLISGDNKPYILITSRNREWEKGIEVMDLNELKLEDAVEFVKKGLSIEDESQDEQIKALVEKLQRFPLAIQQAIAYIHDQRVTGGFEIDHYLEQYEKKTKDLLDSEVFRGIDNDYAKTTFTTWQITIDKIKSDKQYGELALNILDVIAYFAPENITREMFLDLAGGDEEQLKSAVRLLVRYSMVNSEQKQSVLSIHRLVQEVTRLELKGQGKEKETLKKALEFVERNMGKENLDHAVSAWDYASEYDELVKEFSNLPSSIISKLNESVNYEKANLFGERASKLLSDKLGPGNPDTLTTKHNMAGVLSNQGKYEEALRILYPLYEKDKKNLKNESGKEDIIHSVMSIARNLSQLSKYDEAEKLYEGLLNQRKISETNDEKILTAFSDYAILLLDKGKYDRALNILKEVFDKRSAILGVKNAETLITKRHIATTRVSRGEYTDDVLENFIDASEGLEEVLGPDHPDTLSTKGDMASLLQNQHKYDQALLIYREVTEKLKKVLGENHPDTLAAMHNMALCFKHQLQYQKALDILEDVYQKQSEALGPEHRDTLHVKSNIASVLSKQGNYEEALKTFKEVYEKIRDVLDHDHLDTLTTQGNMAEVLYKQGKYEEALTAYKEIYEKRKEVLGPGHPDTLTTQSNVAEVLSEQGKYEEALKIHQEVYEKIRDVLDHDHPDTLTTQGNMAEVLYKQGNYEKALKTIKEVYEKIREVLDHDHPSTLTTQSYKAFVLYKQGKYDEALRICHDVLEKQKETLGSHHPSTLKTKQNIVEVLSAQGKDWTMLHLAASYGNEEEVKCLLNEGYDINAITKDGFKPLYLAVKNNNKKTVNALIEYSKNRSPQQLSSFINSRAYLAKRTSLHIAAQNGNKEIVEILLQNGAYYNAKDTQGKAPLDLAKSESDVKNLLGCINQLFQAVQNNKKDVVNSLLEGKDSYTNKVILNTRNSGGKTLVQVASAT